MGEWYEIAHSIFIGIFFSFLASKLISTVTSSPEENLRLVREDDPPAGSVDPGSKSFDPVNINEPEMPAKNLRLVREDDPPAGTVDPGSKSFDPVNINEPEMPAENLRLVREDDPPAGTVDPGSKSFDPVNINEPEMPAENLRLVPEDDPPAGTVDPGSKSFDPVNINEPEMPAENLRLVPEDDPPVGTINPDSKSFDLVDINEPEMPGAGKSLASDILSVDVDDDWEGVESTDLDATFSAAIAFVAAAAADRPSQKVSNEVQLQLYGLYKIATEGPCSVQQPSAIKISARAKWNAWQRLGVMSPEEAMQKYIMIVSELYPSWASGCTIKKDGEADERSTAAKGMLGPVFDTTVNEEGSDRPVFNTSVNEEGSDGPVFNTSVNEEGSDNEIFQGNETIRLAYRSRSSQCCGAAQ